MAFKDPFKDLRGKSETREPEPAPASQPTPGMTYIDEGCEFSGKLKFKDTVRIDGRIEGEIQSQNTVVVGLSGVVRAKIEADSVMVLGVVEGDILARRKITLHDTARVTGETGASRLAALPMLLTHWTPARLRASLTKVSVKEMKQ